MNKGVRIGSIITVIIMIILCTITIFVQKYSNHDVITDDMAVESLKLDSFRREVEKTDSLIKEKQKQKIRKVKESSSEITEHVLPVITDEKD